MNGVKRKRPFRTISYQLEIKRICKAKILRKKNMKMYLTVVIFLYSIVYSMFDESLSQMDIINSAIEAMVLRQKFGSRKPFSNPPSRGGSRIEFRGVLIYRAR